MSAALERMLALIEERSRAEREAILTRAQTEARRLVAESHRDARRRVHAHIAEARALMENRIARAEAALETARRQHRQQRDAALLAAAWPLIHVALEKRWRDDDTRRVWTRSLLEHALAVLPRTRGEIACPQGFAITEREALSAQISAASDATTTFVESADIVAGLRITATGASLDGTLEGLLADRAAIESRLLAEVERSEKGESFPLNT
jgi:hypothetical protein